MAPSVAGPNDFPQRTAGVRRLGPLILEHPHKHGGRGAEPPRQSEALHCVRTPTIPAVLSATNRAPPARHGIVEQSLPHHVLCGSDDLVEWRRFVL
jgi:hypothetical protein